MTFNWPVVAALSAVAAIFLFALLKVIIEERGKARAERRRRYEAPFSAAVLARAVRVPPEDGITLTQRAADELFRNAREADAPGGVYVLAGVSPGGMAGYLYSLDLKAALSHPVGPEMRVFESRGVPIVTDEQSLGSGHLRGHYIDWRTTSRGTGFEFFPYDPDARDEPDEPFSRSDARD
jgi:Fe-S cluster assembly iron-binding protein IscA